MKNKKVYIVEQGEYSDRCIVGVFFDKDKAEKFAEIREKTDPMWGGAFVMDYDILDDKVDLNTPVNKFFEYTIFFDNPYEEDEYETEEEIQCTKESFHVIHDTYLCAYSQRSFKHAKKIAEEQYQLYSQREAAKRGDI